jgi:hypothetical protein
MDLDEAEHLCDALADMASRGPSRNPQALAQASAIIRQIAQWPQATPHVRERASQLDRALSGWLDSDERFHDVLKSHSGEIYALIDQLHSALREVLRFGPRPPPRR